jgi:cytochrome c-type biogenesis protein
MVPVYLALLMGAGVDSLRGPAARARLFVTVLTFFAGFSLVFVFLGLAASSVGSALREHRSALVLGGGLVIALFGLKYLGWLRIAFLDRTMALRSDRTGRPTLRGAFVFGAVFALGWTPCVGPVLGSVLAYTAVASTSPLAGAAYLLVYSLGVGLPFIVVGAIGEGALRRLRALHRHLPKLEKATGAVMLIAGLALAVTAGAKLLPVRGEAVSVQPEDPTTPARPRVLAFVADDCPTCEKMKPRLEQLTKDCLGKRIEIVQINVSDRRHARVAERHGVSAVPTLQLFDTSGRQVRQLFGERGLDELRSGAAELIAGTCAGEKPRDDFAPAGPGCAVGSADGGKAELECRAN